MGVIGGGKVVSSGDEGGGTCHNDKPDQSKDKVLKMGIQKDVKNRFLRCSSLL